MIWSVLHPSESTSRVVSARIFGWKVWYEPTFPRVCLRNETIPVSIDRGDPSMVGRKSTMVVVAGFHVRFGVLTSQRTSTIHLLK